MNYYFHNMFVETSDGYTLDGSYEFYEQPNYPDFNPTDLAYFAKELFKDEIKVDREKLREYGRIDIRPFLSELETENERGATGLPKYSVSGEKGKNSPTVQV